MSLIPGLGRSPGGGNGNPLQYSRLRNPMDRGAWRATVRGVAKSRTRLSRHTHTHSPLNSGAEPTCLLACTSHEHPVLINLHHAYDFTSSELRQKESEPW